MELIRGDQDSLPFLGESVISIGNYDGVHLGHQALINELKALGNRYSLPATIMTFEPYPWEYFQDSNRPSRLTSFPEKLELFKNAGVDRVVCLEFNQGLANTSPVKFVNDYLVRKLKVRCLVLGDDFRFGKDRAGSIDLLNELGILHNFDVITVGEVIREGARVSSSGIRLALENKDLILARKLLGHRYTIGGTVTVGDQLGREWGFRTANIDLGCKDTPLRGVFAVLVNGLENEPQTGITNLGNRPTVSGQKFLLETHIFDFNEDIYGENIRVEFCDWIRDERKFCGLDALKNQVKNDIQNARKYFELNPRDD